MRIVLPRDEFRAAFAAVTRHARQAPGITSYPYVGIVVDANGRMSVSSDDGETTVIHRVTVPNNDAGAVTLPADRLSDLLGTLPDGDVTMAADKDRVRVNCRRSEWTVQCPLYDTVPHPALDGDDATPVRVDGERLLAAITNAGYAFLTDKTASSVLGGLHFDISGRELTVVTTDGRRLAAEPIAVQTDAEVSVTVPVGITALAANLSGPVDIGLGTRSASFSWEGWEVLSRIYDGQYPQWRRIAGADRSQMPGAVVNGADFADALKRAAAAGRDSEVPRISVATVEGGLRISSVSDTAEFEEVVDAENHDRIEATFGTAYLSQMFSHAGRGDVTLQKAANFPLYASGAGQASLHVLVELKT